MTTSKLTAAAAADLDSADEKTIAKLFSYLFGRDDLVAPNGDLLDGPVSAEWDEVAGECLIFVGSSVAGRGSSWSAAIEDSTKALRSVVAANGITPAEVRGRARAAGYLPSRARSRR